MNQIVGGKIGTACLPLAETAACFPKKSVGIGRANGGGGGGSRQPDQILFISCRSETTSSFVAH